MPRQLNSTDNLSLVHLLAFIYWSIYGEVGTQNQRWVAVAWGGGRFSDMNIGRGFGYSRFLQ